MLIIAQNVVKLSAIAIISLFILILIFHGINEPSMRIAIRLTARTSCILFLWLILFLPDFLL